MLRLIGLWGLLVKKRVNHLLVPNTDMATYKRIVEITNGQLETEEASNDIKT